MQSAPHTSLMVNSETKKTDTSRPNANVTGIINRTKPDRSEARYTVLNSKHPLATITHEAERRTNSASPTTARSLTLPGQGGTDSASAAELAFHHRGRHLTRLLTSSPAQRACSHIAHRVPYVRHPAKESAGVYARRMPGGTVCKDRSAPIVEGKAAQTRIAH